MKFGVYVANFGETASPRALMELASDAERCGWDGFFLYDHLADDGFGMSRGEAVVDTWIALAAAAQRTARMRIGPLVTPLARRRPWKVAREIVSLDRLSGGRAVLGVGLGGEEAFTPFGEEADGRVRAAKLDEALDLVTALCRGGPVAHHGAHYRAVTAGFEPGPAGPGGIPIWVAATLGGERPLAASLLRRAARADGVFPMTRSGAPVDAADLVALQTSLAPFRDGAVPMDLVVAGATAGSARGQGEAAARCAEAGATWWLEWLEPSRGGLEAFRARVLEGPPGLPSL